MREGVVQARRGMGFIAVAIIAIVVLFIVIALGVSVGELSIPLKSVVYTVTNKLGMTDVPVNRIHESVIWDFRLSRALVAALSGAGLAICGAVLQSLLKNALAEPYVLGVSAGASTGAVLIVVSGVGAGAISLSLGAFTGAFAAFALLLCLIIALAGVVMYASYYYVRSHSDMFEFTCAANLKQRDAATDFHLDASFVLTLRYSGDAMVSVDGIVHKNGKDYVLRRNAEFRYSPYIQSLYKLNHFTLHPGVRDNVPDSVLNTNFSYLYISKITGMNDAVLIGSRVMPLIICHTR